MQSGVSMLSNEGRTGITGASEIKQLDLVSIPATAFEMGSTLDEVEQCVADWEPNLVDPSYRASFRDWILKEYPKHRVHVKPFLIGRFPVTNAEYQAFVDSCRGPVPESIFAGAPCNHPVWESPTMTRQRMFNGWGRGPMLNAACHRRWNGNAPPAVLPGLLIPTGSPLTQPNATPSRPPSAQRRRLTLIRGSIGVRRLGPCRERRRMDQQYIFPLSWRAIHQGRSLREPWAALPGASRRLLRAWRRSCPLCTAAWTVSGSGLSLSGISNRREMMRAVGNPARPR